MKDFCLSGKVIALHMDKSMLNLISVFLFFLSRVACFILNLADKENINLITANMRTHLTVEADYLS